MKIQKSFPRDLGYRMPAEWEPHQATWLTWPKDPLTWPDRVEAVQDIYCRMIKAIAPGEKVNLLVDDAFAEQEVQKKLASQNMEVSNLQFHRIPTADAWIRDYGPNFLIRDGFEVAYSDWIFNAWGEKYESLMADDSIPKKLAPLLNMAVFEPGIVLEGGSIDVNGRGTVLTTEQCLLNKNRNPQLTKIQIEDYLKNFLNVRHILWLGEGIVGDDTDGHIDDITRFVAPDTVVTVLEEDTADENYHPLQDNLKRLQAMADETGKGLKIVTLPMPGPIHSNEGRLPASYANFYIANSTVLVPTFSHPNDERAVSTLQKLFPGRRVQGIPAADLVWGMGAFHCLTQQQPAVIVP